MARYHISPDIGPSKCFAESDATCKFRDSSDHYDSIEEASQAYADKPTIPTLSKSEVKTETLAKTKSQKLDSLCPFSNPDKKNTLDPASFMMLKEKMAS